MSMFKLFVNAMLVFSIYQCLLSTSEGSMHASLNQSNEVVHGRNNEDSNQKWATPNGQYATKYSLSTWRRLFSTPRSQVRKELYYKETTSEPEAVKSSSTREDNYLTNKTGALSTEYRTSSHLSTLSKKTTQNEDSIYFDSVEQSSSTIRPFRYITFLGDIITEYVGAINTTSSPNISEVSMFPNETIHSEERRQSDYKEIVLTNKLPVNFKNNNSIPSLIPSIQQHLNNRRLEETSTKYGDHSESNLLKSHQDKNKISRENNADIKVNTQTNKEEKHGAIEDNHMIPEVVSNITSSTTPSSIDCPSCVKRGMTEEDVKQIRLNMFKESLFQKMHISQDDFQNDSMQSQGYVKEHIPKLPPSLLEQINNDNGEMNDKDPLYGVDKETIISGDEMENCVKAGNTGCYSFSLKDNIKSDVAEAELWFYNTKSINDVSGQRFTVSELDSGNEAANSIVANETTFTKDGWIRWNVTKTLLRWVDMKVDKQLLSFQCSTCLVRSYQSLFGVKTDYKPLLVVKYAMKRRVVRKKRSETCDPIVRCCKRDLEINFNELPMMTHIYYPPTLHINYCYGECNFSGNQTYENAHSRYQQAVRLNSNLTRGSTMNEQLKLCCVPTSYNISSLLSYMNGVTTRLRLPIVVTGCGCL